MQAVRFNSFQEFPALEDVERPAPGPGEVLLKVAGAGACHSDVAIFSDFTTDTAPPGLAPPYKGGAHALVVGLGGLGMTAVQILRALTGATVIATDVKEEAMRQAVALGALTVPSGPEWRTCTRSWRCTGRVRSCRT